MIDPLTLTYRSCTCKVFLKKREEEEEANSKCISQNYRLTDICQETAPGNCEKYRNIPKAYAQLKSWKNSKGISG